MPVTYFDSALVKVGVKDASASVIQTGDTTLLEMDVGDLSRIFVQIDVVGQALDTFLIQAKCHTDASYITLYNTAGDFTSPRGLLVGTNGTDLTTLAAAASGWFVMDVRGLKNVKILASSGNAAGSTVSAYAGGR